MGNTWEVYGWHEIAKGAYAFEPVYRGESYEEALDALVHATYVFRHVKLEYRVG
jgi:hypothetical protein